MVSAIINIPEEYDKKAAMLKIQTKAKSKNEIYVTAIREYLDNHIQKSDMTEKELIQDA